MKQKMQQIEYNQDDCKQNINNFGLNNKLKNEINSLKKPYLTRIQLTKLKVNVIKNKTQNQSKKIKKSEQQKQQSIKSIQFLLQKKVSIQQPDNQIIRFQSFQQQQIKSNLNENKVIDLPLAQWPGRDKNKIFNNSQTMLQEYQRIFKKKIYSNLKKDNVYSYKKAQNSMLLSIYEQIKDKQTQTVSFSRAQEFLRSHENFLKVYDLDINKINDILHFSAQKYQNKLTKLQFLQIFCMNYSNSKEQQDQIKYKIQKQCCMNEQNWIQLKKIFIQLDTFGDGYIKTEQLFAKMKKTSVSKQLLQSNAIYFPNIKRYYSFKKIMFQLQYKDKLPQILTWKILQDKIVNFQHINYPTIDEISLQQIKKAIIVDDSQSFMIKQQILKILKRQFKQCPKFSNNFVKSKYFCTELLTSDQLKPFFCEYVRADVSKSEKILITLENNIKMLKIYGSQFIDLDQMLFYFSVKGFEKQLRMKNFEQVNLIQSDIEEEFQEKKKLNQKLKRIKSLQKIQKVMNNRSQYSRNLKNKQNKNIVKTTFVQEFNITKKRDHLTIRQQKVKYMIEQKISKQKSQIKPYVKARTIPASINGQHYLNQKSTFLDKKQKQKMTRQQQRLQDEKKLKNLMTNTKLFNKTNAQSQNKNNNIIFTQRQNFQAKPIEWYVTQRNLLEIIQNEKEQRRKNKLKQTKEKYIFGFWKNLPYNDKKGKLNKEQSQNQSKSDSLQKQLESNRRIQDSKNKKVIKSIPVPDFQKLHKQFTQELQLKKKSRSPTKIIQFKLTSLKKKPQQIKSIQLNSTKSRIKNSLVSQRQQEERPLIIGTTLKYECMVQKNHKKLVQRQQQEYKKYLQQVQKEKKKKIFKKFMRNAFRQQKMKNKKNKIYKKCNNNNNIEIIRQKQLNKMYQRVLNRPFLFQKVQISKVITSSFINNKQKHKKKSSNNKNQLDEKLIPKIIIPKQNQDEKYLNSVEEVEWEDRDTEREQEIQHEMKINSNNNNNKEYQQYNEDESYYHNQDEEYYNQYQNYQEYEQNQQEYKQNQQVVNNYHNQSF